MQEHALAERLVSYDTSSPEGTHACAAFIKGWLDSHEIAVEASEFGGLPVLRAHVGPADGPKLILHGHIDVVPGHPEQFEPRIEGDRLYGRGSYDMKGGLAAILCALRDLRERSAISLLAVIVPDEEAEDLEVRSTDELLKDGLTGDFAITGEPTNLHVGIQAKGVLALRCKVRGRAAHGATPWLGDNAVLKAIDAFRRIESMPFTRESSEFFDRPSVNLGRIEGGDVLNKVPDVCTMVVDIRYLPDQDPGEILKQVRAIPDVEVERTFLRAPAYVERSNPYVAALSAAAARLTGGEATSVGRDGASDAVSFLAHGIPAVEFGPDGAGHHGPDEWVSIASLERYRRALIDFVIALPSALRAPVSGLRAVEGGRA